MRIVQKYGGSSVATAKQIKSIAEHIKKQKKNNEIVVVLSARGKTTNKLLKKAHQFSSYPNKREVDQLLSIGEIESISLLAVALEEIGVPAISLTGRQAGIKTNNNFSRAFIKDINTSKIEKELKKGKVVVIAGFQGTNKNKDTTTLGRGGSDTTAVALAAKLKCACEIYTDVPSVYTTSPQHFKDAKQIRKLSYDEMMEMSVSGAKVLETRCVELAKKYNVPLYVGKSLEKEKNGSIISSSHLEEMSVKSLAIKEDISVLEAQTNMPFKIVKVLEKQGLNLEMLTINQNKISFAILSCEVENVKKELKKLQILCKNTSNLTKFTLVGLGISTHAEICKKLYSTLFENNIKIFQSVLTEISLQFTINKKDNERTVKIVTELFGLWYEKNKFSNSWSNWPSWLYILKSFRRKKIFNR